MPSNYADAAPYHHLLAPPSIALLERLHALAGPAPAAVLDLGCGVGERVAALRRSGYDCHGVELDLELLHAGWRRHPDLSAPPQGSGKLIHGDPLEVFDLLRPPLGLAFCAENLDGGVLAGQRSEQDLEAVLGQLWDLTRPAGKLLLALPNFDHLAAEARRVEAAGAELEQAAGLGPDGEPQYVELLGAEPRRGSPQLGSLTDTEIRLYLAPISKSSEAGMVELERQYVFPRERRQDAQVESSALVHLRMQLRVPEGEHEREHIWLMPLLNLTRERLERCLANALPADALRKEQWSGGYDGEAWSAGAALSVVELG